MRTEKAVTGVIIKAALVIMALYLFYIVATVKERPVPQPVGRQGVIVRVLDVLRRGFHVQSPYISEEDLREKARRYLK
jgi:hypothetical protein